MGSVVLVIFCVKHHLASSVEGTYLLGLFCQFRLRGISHDRSNCSSWCLLLGKKLWVIFFYQSFCHLCCFCWFSESFWKRRKMPTKMNSQTYYILWLVINWSFIWALALNFTKWKLCTLLIYCVSYASSTHFSDKKCGSYAIYRWEIISYIFLNDTDIICVTTFLTYIICIP